MKYGRDLSAPTALATMEIAVQYELLLPKLSPTVKRTGICVPPIRTPGGRGGGVRRSGEEEGRGGRGVSVDEWKGNGEELDVEQEERRKGQALQRRS